ncbi:MAG: DUF3465 domain-containing protein [Acidobacteriota bacterium]
MKPLYPRRRLGRKRYFVLLLIIGVVWLISEAGSLWKGRSAPAPAPEPLEAPPPGTRQPADPTASMSVPERRAGAARIVEAFASRESGVWVEAAGLIVRHLPDDNDGSRHQRFIVEVRPGHTVLLSHNIDLEPPLDAGVGDSLVFRGRYEWNDRGGVIHWTHPDPQGRHGGGWVRVE